MKEPLTVENSQTFSKCCFVCCCSSEPLYLCSTIPVTGYTSGQTIHVAISADNKSAQEVDWFGVQMFQVTSEWWLSRFKQLYNGIWGFIILTAHHLHLHKYYEKEAGSGANLRETGRKMSSTSARRILCGYKDTSRPTNRYRDKQSLQSQIRFGGRFLFFSNLSHSLLLDLNMI